MNEAYSVLGVTKQNFLIVSESSSIILYQMLVRLHLEYTYALWLPYCELYKQDMAKTWM